MGAHRIGGAAGADRILVVEDGQPFRKALVRILEGAGFEAEAVGDGEAALALLLDGGAAFTLVLADLRMPGMGGAELAARLREELEEPPPVVLMTGDVAAPALTAPDAGGPEVLVKPFGAEELLAAISRALG